VLEPFDLKGVGFINYRYLDPGKSTIRGSTSRRSAASAGLPPRSAPTRSSGRTPTSTATAGTPGQIAWMDWKYLGEKEILAPAHAEHVPVKWDDKVDWTFDEGWEKRKVYVVEGISKLPQYAFSKRVLFIDKEAWGIPYSDMYDRGGELWKIWINDVASRKKFADAPATPNDEVIFAPAIVMIDIQLEHATRAALPSHRFPGSRAGTSTRASSPA
jgi:hypothetical protein